MRDPRISEALPELLREGLIDDAQAERIRTHYGSGAEHSSDRQRLITTLAGSLLVGLGVILLVAHNWDELPRTARTLLAFLPVLLGLGLVGYTLHRRGASVAWREGGAFFLACALCACVALVSQVYHIHGELDGYLLTCTVLMLPLLYLPGSYLVALGYVALVLWYAVGVRMGEFLAQGEAPWLALPLLAAAWPMYALRAKREGHSVGWLWLGLFLAIATFTMSQLFNTEFGNQHLLAMVCLAGAYTLVPSMVKDSGLRTGPWVLVGALTQLWLLFMFSSFTIWSNIFTYEPSLPLRDTLIIILLIAVFAAGYVLTRRYQRPLRDHPFPEAGLVFLLIHVVGIVAPGIAVLLVNLLLLVMGVHLTRQGIAAHSMRRMNLGLLLLSVLVLMRFFDTGIDFVLRGLAFIGIGVAFLTFNLRMLRQRRGAGQAGDGVGTEERG